MPTVTGPDEKAALLLDTSAAVAFVIEGHEAHPAVVDAIRGRRLGLAGHAWFETYSVLTRLPGRLRRSPADVIRLLTRNFPASAFLGEAHATKLGGELAALGISGGAVSDALVAAAARQHQLPLLTGDARARMTYERLGIEIEPIP